MNKEILTTLLIKLGGFRGGGKARYNSYLQCVQDILLSRSTRVRFSRASPLLDCAGIKSSSQQRAAVKSSFRPHATPAARFETCFGFLISVPAFKILALGLKKKRCFFFLFHILPFFTFCFAALSTILNFDKTNASIKFTKCTIGMGLGLLCNNYLE